MACLQIYRELLLLATFSDLIQIQKRYPTFLIQLENYFSYQAKTFLVSKLLENFLFGKYLISVAAALKSCRT